MIWLKYTLTPLGSVSAGKSREVGNDRPVHEVLPGAVVRGALGGAWWLEEAGMQAEFDTLFETEMNVHAAVPSTPGKAAVLNPLGWSRRKYPADSAYQLTRPTPVGSHVGGRGWDVPRSWTTATTRTKLTNGVADDGNLFTRRAVKGTVTYSGYLALDENTAQEKVDWLIRERRISIGGQLSVMGRCIWRCEELSKDPFPVPDLETVAVTALQPIILLDALGVNSLDLHGAIQAALAPIDPNVEVKDVAVRPVSVGGWHGRAGFPKPMEWALDAGSWALVRSTAGATAWEQLRKGLGVRRAEGYGALAITASDKRPEFTPPRQQELHDAATPSPAVDAEPVAIVEGRKAEAVRDMVHAIPEDARAQAVEDLLKLAWDMEELASTPMGAMSIGVRLNKAADGDWARPIDPKVVRELLSLLKAPAERQATVETLEKLQ